MTKTNIQALPKDRQFPAMLDLWKGEIKRALPSHINPDRMCRIALTAFRQNPTLQNCEPASIFAAIVQSAQLGLEVGINGQSYLVPYKNQCQFIPGWKGLVDLVNRAGKATVWTGAVYAGDDFDYALGDSPYLKHKPGNDDQNLSYVYAIGRVKGAEWPIIEVWTVEKVKRHRDRYNKVGQRHYSFENFEMYARKVVLLQVIKFMPQSPELAVAVAMNDSGETGRQGINIDDVIDGTWAPMPEETETTETVERPALPSLSEDEFKAKQQTWFDAITNGKKTPAQIITMLKSKYALTDAQINTITDWGKQ